MAAVAARYIESVMLFPSIGDDEKRKQFFESTLANAFVQTIEQGEFDGSNLSGKMVRWAIKSASLYLDLRTEGLKPSAWSAAKTGSVNSIHGGVIAAYILLFPLLMHYRHSQSVGRGVAYCVLEQWLFGKAKMQGAKLRKLQSIIWKRYEPVSHLWVAYILSEHRIPTSAQQLIRFIALSEQIRKCAEKYKPRNHNDTLLDSTITWKAPKEFPLPLIELNLVLDSLMIPDEWTALAKGG